MLFPSYMPDIPEATLSVLRIVRFSIYCTYMSLGEKLDIPGLIIADIEQLTL